jgi:hypothetical protein
MHRLWLLPCALLLSLVAHAADTPSDLDLKSAYCLRAVNLEMQIAKAVIAQDPSPDHQQAKILRPTVEGYDSDIKRMNSYLLPKLPTMEPTPILAAAQRADADDKLRRSELEACTAQCAPQVEPNGSRGDKWVACAQACRAKSPAFTRMDACHPVNWLPF